MIQPTPKAQTLPDDLKSYWDETMAEKFPMSCEEAMAWTAKRYNFLLGYYDNNGEKGFYVQVQQLKEFQQGQFIPTGYYYVRDNIDRLTKIYQRNDQVIITDLKPNSIKEKLKEYKT